MVDIALIKSNSIVYDSRVRKIARSLGKKYSLVTLGWNRDATTVKDTRNDYQELRLFNLKAPIGKATLVAYLPAFWIWILFRLVICRPEVVHACDLDTMLPSFVYKVLFRKKLVFDIFDRYAMANIPQKFARLYSFVNLVEELFSKKVDALIIVAENILGTFRRRPKQYFIIRNCPDLHIVDSIKSKNSMLTLVYTGNVVRYRGLERITEAIKNIEGVDLVFAGRVIDKEFFDQILETPNVKYMGHLLPVDALDLEARSDVMMILYDFNIPIHQVANPNKTFEAMMFGLPVITNLTPELIHETNCGILVDYNDINQIRSAIISLRDDTELRNRLGNNGRKAFEQKYSWRIMEKELYKVYGGLLRK